MLPVHYLSHTSMLRERKTERGRDDSTTTAGSLLISHVHIVTPSSVIPHFIASCTFPLSSDLSSNLRQERSLHCVLSECRCVVVPEVKPGDNR